MPAPLDAIIRRLANVLDRENLALKAMDLHGTTTLLAEKTAAMSDFTTAAEMGSGAAHPDLVAAMTRLDGLASENRRLLERAIAAQQRVIGIVARAMEAAIAEPSYGAAGQLAPVTRLPLTMSTRA